MRVGWLVDMTSAPGGAELTQAEFLAAAPDDARIYNLQPGPEPWPECDTYVVQNCVKYSAEDIGKLTGRVIKYWHDVGPHLQEGVMDALNDIGAIHVCCSPIQADYMGLSDAVFIPPPVDLDRFEQAGAKMNGNRKGSVCVGSWRNYGKAAHKVALWAQTNGAVDFYGDGPFAPSGSVPVPYEAMPELLAKYERFVYLPMVLEPFGRTVVEAWSAGLIVTTNNLVGAKYWIEEKPEALETAASDFWRVVLDARKAAA